MKISQEYYQFPERTLILVCDNERARLLFAAAGMLSELASVKAEPPILSGGERYFHDGSGGAVTHASSPTENVKEETFQRLLRALKHELPPLVKKRRIETMVLLAPQHLVAQIQDQLPRPMRELVTVSVGVDLVHTHPTVILERITAERAGIKP